MTHKGSIRKPRAPTLDYSPPLGTGMAGFWLDINAWPAWVEYGTHLSPTCSTQTLIGYMTKLSEVRTRPGRPAKLHGPILGWHGPGSGNLGTRPSPGHQGLDPARAHPYLHGVPGYDGPRPAQQGRTRPRVEPGPHSQPGRVQAELWPSRD